MLRRKLAAVAVAALSWFCLGGRAAGQTAPLFEEIKTVSSTIIPVVSAPFTIQAAGTYDVTLTDLGAQLTPAAPLNAVQLALTRGATVAGTLTAAGTKQLALDPGTYVVRVTGAPGAGSGSGLFSVNVQAPGAAQPAISFSDTISPVPATTPSSVRVFQASIAVPATGTYTAELVDLNFPAVLQNASLIVTQGSGVLGAPLNLPAAPPSETFASTTFTATQGAATFYAIGDATTAGAGLLALRLRDAGGALTYSKVLDIGRTTRPAAGVTLSPSNYLLALNDLGFPAMLAQSGAIVVRDAAEVARTTTSGTTTPFTVTASGSFEVYTLAVPGQTPGAGALAVELRGGSSGTPYSAVATAGGDSTTVTPVFAFPVDIITPGAHSARTADLQFPAALSSVQLAIVQGGSVIARRDTVGTSTGTLAAGKAQLLVFANPAGTVGTLQQRAGLFSLDLTPSGGTPLLEVTQGVGAVFSARSFSVSTPGDYRFTVNDVGFPSPFAEFAAAVTRGTERLGLVYGQGSFDVLGATVGTYFVNFISRVDATTNAGTYRVAAVTKPASPGVTLSANPLSPANGSTTTLTWAATSATACTASGAWTGPRATSGTETTAAINTATIYTLACTGDGGTTTKTLTVTPAVPTNASGGGGSMDVLLLTLLSGMLTVARWVSLRGRMHPAARRH
jgi:hypothetical protein